MSKKSRSTRSRKVTPLGPTAAVSPLRQHYFDLLADPMAFLTDVSSLIAAADPRSYSPLEEQQPVTDFATFIDMIADDPGVETTVLLRVMAALAPAEAAAQAADAARERTDPVPPWVAGISTAKVTDSARMVDALGEAGNYLLEVRAAHLPPLTMVVYVDHLAGPLVKDAFYLEDTLQNARRRMQAVPGGDEFVWSDVDRATLRGIVERGIQLSAALHPPVATDSWPMSRALTEWALRMLPEAAVLPEPDPDPALLRPVVDEFVDSTEGSELLRTGVSPDAADQIGEMLAVYAVTRGTGEVLSWSPRMVEDLLGDFWPRKVIAPHLDADLPAVLIAWIRFAHNKTDVPNEMSAAVLERAVRLGDEFLADGHRVAEPADVFDVGPSPYGSLEDVVGADRLQTLSAEPLPDEEFDDSAVPEDLRPAVEEIRVLLDRASTLYPSAVATEVRTAQRRLLARAAVEAPEWFHRRAKAAGSANAICWLIGQANGLVGQHGIVRLDELTRVTGATGSASQRAQRLQGLLGMPTLAWDVCLADAGLLVGFTRAQVLAERDG